MNVQKSERVREHAAAAWAEILDGTGPSDSDSFFQKGGTSLKALRLCARLGSLLGHKVPVKVLLKHGTFADFVTALEETAR
ncbi:phosphopantetheine-binding protein [Streptomyces koyangensis]|uniref:phosphopantetheine-binding protein n=1 Tax=Streptomyces koyangensis TaxID=188770 RepID=UPI00337DDF81